MAETVLVTGGSGYVGGWCIVELLQRGFIIRSTIRSLSKETAFREAISSVTENGDSLSFFEADLTSDAGWDEAIEGCDYVLHVASPLGSGSVKSDDDLIVPARDGTLRILRAASRAGVKRVVVTSSTAACSPPMKSSGLFADEATWTDLADRDLNAYRKSKVIAEKAAWDFIWQNTGPMTLTTILPPAILGPVLMKDKLSSVQLVKQLLTGNPPGILNIGFCIVDVRDLADFHVRAMLAPEAAGQRFITAGKFMWMEDIAHDLRSRLGEDGKKIPTKLLPDFAVRLLAFFIPALKEITSMLGRKQEFSSAKAQRVLHFSPRPISTTILDCARSLL